MEKHDIVIVGGGLAGLGVAYQLRDRDFVVLEAGVRAGGRIESRQMGRYWLNLGAHILNGDDSLTAQLAREFGLQLAYPHGSVTAIAMNGRVVRGGPAESMPFRLALSPAGRISLARAGLRVRSALRKARAADPAALLGAHSDPAFLDELPVDAGLDSISFADVLGSAHPDVAALFNTAAQRSGGESNQISGHYGVIASLGAWGIKRPNIVGGTERLIDGLLRTLGDRVVTSQRVTAVSDEPDGVHISVPDGEQSREILASVCVLAVPAPTVTELVRALPAEKRNVLEKVRYSPYFVAGIFTKETTRMPWDQIYAMATPKRSFCMLFNPANPLRDAGPRDPGGSLVVYSASETARRHLDMSDTAVRDLFLQDLVDLFPVSRGVIDEVVLKRQPFGAPTPFPGRAAIQKELVQSCGRLVFAGDYLHYAGMDSALRTSLRATGEVESILAGELALGPR